MCACTCALCVCVCWHVRTRLCVACVCMRVCVCMCTSLRLWLNVIGCWIKALCSAVAGLSSLLSARTSRWVQYVQEQLELRLGGAHGWEASGLSLNLSKKSFEPTPRQSYRTSSRFLNTTIILQSKGSPCREMLEKALNKMIWYGEEGNCFG